MSKKLFLCGLFIGLFILIVSGNKQKPAPLGEEKFWDYTLPLDERIENLLLLLSLEEKASLMLYNSPAIERLGIPEYNWWNEALHGIARAGKATVFPQAIGMAATFDTDLIERVATAISDEGRAKYNAALAINNRLQYMGITYWSPNINIFRDPRWGRGHETYGEDPYLSGKLGSAFVRGLQGNNPQYLKTAACAKHFAVHSGPEGERHVFNAKPPVKDFYETYLPAFKMLVKDANVEAVMCAYNRTYDLPCCGSDLLLQKILRADWGFKGHVVSDCWALVDFHANHKVSASPAESAAMAVKAGVNLNCGTVYLHLVEAVNKGLITETEITTQLRYLLRTRFKLGLFDPPSLNPYNKISPEIIGCETHVQLAREAASKSVVLLKNTGILPLKNNLKDIQIVGIHGNDAQVLYGNYHGQSKNAITIAEGITANAHPGTRIEFRQGHLLDKENANPIDWTTSVTSTADAVIAVMGISNLLEGEEGEAIASPDLGDRFNIELPETQTDYLKKLRSQGNKPLILVLTGGSPIAIANIEHLADAILFVWYPGEQGGMAVADIIFGKVNPSGRLPLTFPKSLEQLPPYTDYSMAGRTYKYFEQEPLYPFGFGLSYTTFSYNNLSLSNQNIKAGESIIVKVDVTNVGNTDGEEVVQTYITDLQASYRTPLYALVGFNRLKLKPGETKSVSFEILPEMMELVLENGDRTIEPGTFAIHIGGALPGKRSNDLGAAAPVSANFEVLK